MHKVLVPLSTKEAADSTTQLHFARSTYINKLVLQYDLIPIFVSPTMIQKKNMVDELYTLCSGILLMGGGDVEPSYYGETPHPQNDPPDILRDDLEMHILKKALHDELPILGICRGCQVLGVASGGTLYQHIPDLKIDEEHGISDYNPDAYPNKLPRHDVVVEQGTKAYDLLKKEVVMTNSAHHQYVLSVGQDFRISGRSKKGITEIIEHIDPEYFCFGLQSHPEVFVNSGLEPFFRAFAEAVKR